MYPYILNINEDAQLSGMVKLFIQEGPYVRLSASIEKQTSDCLQSNWSGDKYCLSIHTRVVVGSSSGR